MKPSSEQAPAADVMPAIGNTRKMVAQWSAKIAEQQAAAEKPQLVRMRSQRPKVGTPDEAGRPCLCSCHDRDVFVPADPAGTAPEADRLHVRGKMAGKAPGAAHAILSRIPRPKRMLRAAIPSFAVIERDFAAPPSTVAAGRMPFRRPPSPSSPVPLL